jgi:hypothetical protein
LRIDPLTILNLQSSIKTERFSAILWENAVPQKQNAVLQNQNAVLQKRKAVLQNQNGTHQKPSGEAADSTEEVRNSTASKHPAKRRHRNVNPVPTSRFA